MYNELSNLLGGIYLDGKKKVFSRTTFSCVNKRSYIYPPGRGVAQLTPWHSLSY